MLRQVTVLQHAAVETLGTFADVLGTEGIQVRPIRLYAGEPCPLNLLDSQGLIVMGGPMGVRDHAAYPFLRDEMRLIEDALKRDKPILGVCLGSQLLATALGSDVRRGARKEIGWYRVALTKGAQSDLLWKGSATSFTAFHWHGDIFNLPRDSVSLASSDLTPHQAFRYGTKAYGLLFHIETTEELVAGMVRSFPEELQEAGVPGEQILTESNRNLPGLRQIAERFFGHWYGLLQS